MDTLNNAFCVYLTTYNGNLLPKYYIGSTSLAKIARGYRGSVASKKYSALWKSEQQQAPHLFKVQVLETFASRAEALAAECEMQEALDAVKDSRFVNQSLASKDGFFGRIVTQEDHPMFGVKHTAESKKKMSTNGKSLIKGLGKSKPKSESTKAKMSCAATKRWEDPNQRLANSEALSKHVKTAEHRENISKALVGYKHGQEMKDKISALHKGRKRDPSSIEKTAAAHRGRKRSEETCDKLRAAWDRRRQLKENSNG